uniref:Uncharacterized protein n=1 Tax=Panagrolaimus davidi TaxID=227884 RepID=A0A914PZG9_9BILA
MDSTRSSISPPPTLSPIPDAQILTFDKIYKQQLLEQLRDSQNDIAYPSNGSLLRAPKKKQIYKSNKILQYNKAQRLIRKANKHL